MKGFFVVYILSLLVITASCTNKYSIDSLSIKDDVRQIIFFSDETKVQQEMAYYDALIELRKEFPKEVENLMVFPKDEGKKYFESLQIKKSPAIIVIYNNEIIANIHGQVTKDQIMQPITNALK
jgi:hypothetical protein